MGKDRVRLDGRARLCGGGENIAMTAVNEQRGETEPSAVALEGEIWQ